nr:MAG TPA: hypothetical protein [Caudoviricetes sp.]
MQGRRVVCLGSLMQWNCKERCGFVRQGRCSEK